MTRTALVASLLALSAFAGCVQTVETTYDQQLVDAVGRGSDQVAAIESMFERASRASVLDDPDVDRAMTALIEGRLADLSVDDIRTMRRANRHSRKLYDRVLRDFDQLEQEIRAARIDPAEHADVSDGASEFVDAWNQYLEATTASSAEIGDELEGLRFTFDEFDKLIDAAINTAHLRHTRKFDRVRDRVMRDIADAADALQRKAEQVDTDPAGDALVELLNDSREARAIFDAVNGDHPDGYLASIAKANE